MTAGLAWSCPGLLCCCVFGISEHSVLSWQVWGGGSCSNKCDVPEKKRPCCPQGYREHLDVLCFLPFPSIPQPCRAQPVLSLSPSAFPWLCQLQPGFCHLPHSHRPQNPRLFLRTAGVGDRSCGHRSLAISSTPPSSRHNPSPGGIRRAGKNPFFCEIKQTPELRLMYPGGHSPPGQKQKWPWAAAAVWD